MESSGCIQDSLAPGSVSVGPLLPASPTSTADVVKSQAFPSSPDTCVLNRSSPSLSSGPQPGPSIPPSSPSVPASFASGPPPCSPPSPSLPGPQMLAKANSGRATMPSQASFTSPSRGTPLLESQCDRAMDPGALAIVFDTSSPNPHLCSGPVLGTPLESPSPSLGASPVKATLSQQGHRIRSTVHSGCEHQTTLQDVEASCPGDLSRVLEDSMNKITSHVQPAVSVEVADVSGAWDLIEDGAIGSCENSRLSPLHHSSPKRATRRPNPKYSAAERQSSTGLAGVLPAMSPARSQSNHSKVAKGSITAEEATNFWEGESPKDRCMPPLEGKPRSRMRDSVGGSLRSKLAVCSRSLCAN
jgi:hypothetical protein